METPLLSKFDEHRHSSFIGLIAGLIAGILNAIFARVLMRIIAIITVGHGSFSVEGTMNIIKFGALVGPLFGLIYGLWFYKLRFPELVKGSLFGMVIAIALQFPVLFIFPDFRVELMNIGLLGFVIFAVMNLSYMLTLAVLTARLDKKLPHGKSRKGIEYLFTVIFGLMALWGLWLLVEAIGLPLLDSMPF